MYNIIWAPDHPHPIGSGRIRARIPTKNLAGFLSAGQKMIVHDNVARSTAWIESSNRHCRWRDGVVRCVASFGRSQLRRPSRRRARPDLCPGLVGAVGQLDPAAVLDAAQHPSVALRHRFPAAGELPARRRSGAEGAGLSVPGEHAGEAVLRANHAIQTGEGCAVELLDPAGLRGASLISSDGVGLASHGIGQRRLVRRPGADAGLPPQGPRAGRRSTSTTRSSASRLARGHAALRPNALRAHHRHRGRPMVGRGRCDGRHCAAGRAAPPLGLRLRLPRARCRCCRSPSIRRVCGFGRRAASGSPARRRLPGNDPAGRAARGPAPGMGRHGLAGTGRSRAGLRGGQGGRIRGPATTSTTLSTRTASSAAIRRSTASSSPPASRATASSSRRRSAAPSPS